ncbi:MAG: M20/M25/M40 family metallo-hydrolase, partial [Bradymonadaceae bacterium]
TEEEIEEIREQTLTQWLEIDSTTGDEAEFLEVLEDHFAAKGLTCRRQPVAPPSRWNLVAAGREDPSVLFSTHVDTVPPHLDVRRDSETLYGRGACDTKGGLWAMSRAADRLLDDGIRDIGFLLVVGEEVDHRGAKEARSLDLSPERIILCEPTQNRVVSGQKGMIKIALEATGRAAHSAFPDEGVSAIHRLLETLERIRATDWPDDPLLGETSVNVGLIDGGVAANVLAPEARAEVLFRIVSAAAPLLERLADLCGAGVELDPITYNDPVEFDPPDDVDTCVVPFNTDAPYLADLGPVWLVGPGDIRVAHSDDEHITREA